MKIKHSLIVVVCSFSLVSCKSNAVSGGGAEFPFVDFRAGTSNEYSWSVVTYDSLGTVQMADSENFAVKVLGTNEKLDSLSGLIKLEAYSLKIYNGSTFDWYKQNSDSLVGIAYSNAGRVPPIVPKRSGSKALQITNEVNFSPIVLPRTIQLMMRMKGIYADSILYYNNARVVYKYPLTVGRSWISLRDPFLQNRQVVGWESITTKAGTFYCAKISTRLPEIDPSLEWYEYVSNRGLIRRTLTGTFVMVDEKGNSYGTITVKEQAEIAATIN